MLFLVPVAGVEPARGISPTDFESASSANSNTPANKYVVADILYPQRQYYNTYKAKFQEQTAKFIKIYILFISTCDMICHASFPLTALRPWDLRMSTAEAMAASSGSSTVGSVFCMERDSYFEPA